MKNAAERRQTIEQRKCLTGHKKRLWIRDDWTYFDIYQVPVDGLVLNIDNRRFRAERLWAEEQLGRPLDPENYPEDERSVESLLLDTSHHAKESGIAGQASNDYESLKRDWLRRGQEEPFWIRPDGTVRNGNRRLAMIMRLQKEGGDSGLQWVDAVILDDSDVDEPSLLEMEQREQLTENLKVRYNDIDYLLALREASVNRDIDMFDSQSIDIVAGELQTMVDKSKSEVLRDLYAIKYMDLFLEDSNQPGMYHKLLRTLERFRDVGRFMLKVEQEYPQDADSVLQVLFAAVRSNQTHDDIRALRQMFLRDRERFDMLRKAIEEEEVVWEESETGDQGGLKSAPTTGGGDSGGDEDDDEEGPGPDVINYPKQEVGRAIATSIDGYGASLEEDILKALKEVRNRLEVIGDRLHKSLSADDPTAEAVREEFLAIVEWCDAHRDIGDSS